MNLKKWVVKAAASFASRRYPVLGTAVLLAALPVLARMGSSYVEGQLLMDTACRGVRSIPVMSLAVFFASVVGFLKYASRSHVLAYALWVATYLSVAVLGIVMFEAFSAPRQWSGSLVLPGLVVLSCGAGILVGASIVRMPWLRRRFGSREPCPDLHCVGTRDVPRR